MKVIVCVNFCENLGEYNCLLYNLYYEFIMQSMWTTCSFRVVISMTLLESNSFLFKQCSWGMLVLLNKYLKGICNWIATSCGIILLLSCSSWILLNWFTVVFAQFRFACAITPEPLRPRKLQASVEIDSSLRSLVSYLKRHNNVLSKYYEIEN